jgi:hypothetical protein
LKKAISILFLLIMTLFFSNCVEKDLVVKKQSSFFNLKEYFENQLASLSEVKRISKTTMIDGNRIEKELDSINFKQELKVFEESDINKIAWIDKYQIDSIYDEKSNLKKIIYKANDQKLRTQKLLISFLQNEVDTIEIFNDASGNIAKLKQHLRYIPSYGYSIESTQKTTLSETHVLSVDVQFLK